MRQQREPGQAGRQHQKPGLSGTAAINGNDNRADITRTGNRSANRLRGGDGNDALNGLAGNDLLSGGHGRDRFVFRTPLNPRTNGDQITDVLSGVDQLICSRAILPGSSGSGIRLCSSPFRSGPQVNAADRPEQRFRYNSSSGSLSYDCDGLAPLPATILMAILTDARPPTLPVSTPPMLSGEDIALIA